MFDIKEQIIKGGEILLIGHYDEFDHKMYKLIARALTTNDDGTESEQQNFKLLVYDCLPAAALRLVLELTLPLDKYHPDNSIAYKSTTCECPYQPPELLKG